MSEERPKNFIERLPEIIDREEKDVSHLDVEMLDILYPDKVDKTFTVTVVFGAPPQVTDDNGNMQALYEQAIKEAKKSDEYRVLGKETNLRHHATYGIDKVHSLHVLFSLVSEFPSCQILVRGKPVPYGRELWLPLLWLFNKDPLEK